MTDTIRTIPPLRYDIVHRIVKEFPDMNIVLNGGITDFDQAEEHLNTNYESPDGDLLPPVHGIMIGRAAYNNPWMFQDADRYNIYSKLFVHIERRVENMLYYVV